MYVYGGASLDDGTPDSASFTTTVAIASAGDGVTVVGNITDNEGDAPES